MQKSEKVRKAKHMIKVCKKKKKHQKQLGGIPLGRSGTIFSTKIIKCRNVL
jgi:hypothetical protein